MERIGISKALFPDTTMVTDFQSASKTQSQVSVKAQIAQDRQFGWFYVKLRRTTTVLRVVPACGNDTETGYGQPTSLLVTARSALYL